jgi:hypothetical protein
VWTSRSGRQVHQYLLVHRLDRIHLYGLVVDDDECRVLGRKQVILGGITNGFATHDASPVSKGCLR